VVGASQYALHMHMSRAAAPPHAKLLGMRILKLVAVTLLIAPLPFVACASSTAASVELWTDINCEDLNSSVFIATDLATAQQNARSATEVPDRVVGSQSIEYDCNKLKHTSNSGFYKLGDLTVFPKVTANARVAVVVSVNDTKKSAPAKSASDCRAEAQRNNLSNQCMEIAATFDYRANETRRVIVRLTKSCFGVVCASGDTCVNEQCVSAKASVLTGTETPNKTPSPGEVEASDAGPLPPPRDSGIVQVDKPDTGVVDAGTAVVDASKPDTGVVDGGITRADASVADSGGPDAAVQPPAAIQCIGGVASWTAQRPNCGQFPYCYDANKNNLDKISCGTTTGCPQGGGRPLPNVCCTKAPGCCYTQTSLGPLPLTGVPCMNEPGAPQLPSPAACFQDADCDPNAGPVAIVAGGPANGLAGSKCYKIGANTFGECQTFVVADPLPPNVPVK
jgi:hypothetical protein